MKKVCTRYDKNPILTRDDIPYPAECVYNSGAIKYEDKYILILRILLLNGCSVLGLAESKDGYNFKVRPEPIMTQSDKEPFKTFENKGLEDPRVTKIDDDYYIFYSCYSTFGFRSGLARTGDFKGFERIAITTSSDYRNTVLFPEKIKGLYARLERPNVYPWGSWLSFSPDLIYWGNHQLLWVPYGKNIWEDHKVGPGAPPIKTDKGWLLITHATTATMDGQTYRLGCALLDLKEPSRVLGIADQFILSPREPYETTGYVHNVVFTCGAIPEDDGTVKIYYGGADTCMNVAVARIDELIELCLENKRPPLG
ncbi:MAG: glycoside hydrolase family 130 protein [Spirochaetes bacterium]|nr:glycoside hydrolase family 130 protein [Spirochaetota bacterium]